MTTPTKPTKEATMPLPVLTERVEKILRNASSMIPDPPRPDAEEARICIPVTVARALADHWLRTQAGWVAWKPGDALPAEPYRNYLTTQQPADGSAPFLWECIAVDFNERTIAYWPIALPAPFAPPQEPA